MLKFESPNESTPEKNSSLENFNNNNIEVKTTDAETDTASQHQLIKNEIISRVSEIRESLGISKDQPIPSVEACNEKIEKAKQEQISLINNLENKTGISWKRVKEQTFNQDHFYRIVNTKGYIDYLSSGVVRSSPDGTESSFVGKFDLGGRTTSFPSFSKSLPDHNYLKKDDTNYIFETDIPMYKRGETADTDVGTINIKGRHWAYRPIDKKTGKTLTELKKDNLLAIYKINETGETFVQETI